MGDPGPCGQLHGHRWGVTFTVESEKLNDQHQVIDFHLLQALCDGFDHSYLNDKMPGGITTAERIALVLWIGVTGLCPEAARVLVEVEESPGASVEYTE